uniref:RING-type domain-containing protein n=1 Tax=Leersia perrieri TaxID=77586 RepID=A0A0D9WY60_9ORYZ
MGFPAVYYCVILPPPLHSLLHLLECISRGCALPASLLFPSSDADADEHQLQLQLQLAAPPADTAATRAQADGIKSRLPVVRFAGSGCCDSRDEGECPRCAVCLTAVEEGAEVRQLGNCSHAFHLPCIDRWVDMGQFTCPLCRSLL